MTNFITSGASVVRNRWRAVICASLLSLSTQICAQQLSNEPADTSASTEPKQVQPDSIRQSDEMNDTQDQHQADANPQDSSAPTRHALTTQQWLSRLASVTQTQNFQVSFVQSRAGSEAIPYLWRHATLEDGSTMEQLNLQNGPGRELIRVGDIVSVFEPDVPPYSIRAGHISGPIPSELLYHPLELKDAYEFVTVGRARVAGRPAQQIRIVSRDNSRFSYQLWLDEATGMLLKLNMRDLQGKLLEQIQVTSLSMMDAPHDYFSRINPASLPKPMATNKQAQGEHGWEVDYLPSGMDEIRRDIRRLALTGQVVEYKMFSDGLVDVSVYVQPAADALGSDLVLRHDLNTFLTLTDGKAQVTVVGEIPLKTANAIATSLSSKQDSP